jgi:predicted MFS family arabinose efflux permease
VYGAKQAAIPLSILLGGLAVPLIAVPFGWRPAFVVAGALGVVAVLAVPRRVGTKPRDDVRASPAAGPFQVAPLLVLSLGLMIAAGTGNAVGTFFVASAVAAGESPATADVLAAVASGAGIVSGSCSGPSQTGTRAGGCSSSPGSSRWDRAAGAQRPSMPGPRPRRAVGVRMTGIPYE